MWRSQKACKVKHCCDMLLSPFHAKLGEKPTLLIPLGEARPRLRHDYKEWRPGGRLAGRPNWKSLRRPPLQPTSSQVVAQKSSVSSTCSEGCRDGWVERCAGVREVIVNHLEVGLLFRLSQSPFYLPENHEFLVRSWKVRGENLLFQSTEQSFGGQ